MKKLNWIFILIAMVSGSCHTAFAQNSNPNDPNDPKMDWWKEAKFGMFIHWGLYSVPAGEWNGKKLQQGEIAEWIQSTLKIPVTDYKAFASQFNPVKFDADEFVKLAKEAGMKYLVLTSKHHEGFAMFKSTDPFNVVDASPYQKDIVRALAEACKKQGIHFGLYYSQAQDWNHAGGSACNGHWDKAQDGDFNKYLDEVAVPQVKEILENYQPEIIWWDTPCDMTPEGAAKFAPILAKYPQLIINNRLGGGVDGDLETPEQYIPATGIPGKNWESCMTMNDTWGFSKNDHNWKSTETIIRNLIDIASKGGNYLLNVGPTSEGLIPEPSIERLKAVGAWMKTNGEAIYGTTASPFNNITWGRVTTKISDTNTKIFLSVFDFPADGRLILSGMENNVLKAYPLASPKTLLKTISNETETSIDINPVAKNEIATVIVLEISGKPMVHQLPVIKAASPIFVDTARFEIFAGLTNETIHYTTDGSQPTIQSAIANGPVKIISSSDIIITARAFVNNKPVSGLAVYTISKEIPLPTVTEAKGGVKYAYYEGSWDKLPDFSKLTPVKTGELATIGLDEKKQINNYGFVFEAFLNVPETKIYTFYITSDDGSMLAIDDKKSVINNGLHAMEEKSLDVALSAGYHKITVQFFQKGGGDGLKVEWKAADNVRDDIKSLIIKN